MLGAHCFKPLHCVLHKSSQSPCPACRTLRKAYRRFRSARRPRVEALDSGSLIRLRQLTTRRPAASLGLQKLRPLQAQFCSAVPVVHLGLLNRNRPSTRRQTADRLHRRLEADVAQILQLRLDLVLGHHQRPATVKPPASFLASCPKRAATRQVNRFLASQPQIRHRHQHHQVRRKL